MHRTDADAASVPVLYWRPRQVVEATHTSKSKVMAAIWSGQLRAFRRDGVWLIRPEDVRKWVEGDLPEAA
jgi:hypothetical protein